MILRISTPVVVRAAVGAGSFKIAAAVNAKAILAAQVRTQIVFDSSRVYAYACICSQTACPHSPAAAADISSVSASSAGPVSGTWPLHVKVRLARQTPFSPADVTKSSCDLSAASSRAEVTAAPVLSHVARYRHEV